MRDFSLLKKVQIDIHYFRSQTMNFPFSISLSKMIQFIRRKWLAIYTAGQKLTPMSYPNFWPAVYVNLLYKNCIRKSHLSLICLTFVLSFFTFSFWDLGISGRFVRTKDSKDSKYNYLISSYVIIIWLLTNLIDYSVKYKH